MVQMVVKVQEMLRMTDEGHGLLNRRDGRLMLKLRWCLCWWSHKNSREGDDDQRRSRKRYGAGGSRERGEDGKGYGKKKKMKWSRTRERREEGLTQGKFSS